MSVSAFFSTIWGENLGSTYTCSRLVRNYIRQLHLVFILNFWGERRKSLSGQPTVLLLLMMILFVQILQRFPRSILRCEDESSWDAELVTSIVALMVDDYAEVTRIPRTIQSDIDDTVTFLRQSEEVRHFKKIICYDRSFCYQMSPISNNIYVFVYMHITHMCVYACMLLLSFPFALS